MVIQIECSAFPATPLTGKARDGIPLSIPRSAQLGTAQLGTARLASAQLCGHRSVIQSARSPSARPTAHPHRPVALTGAPLPGAPFTNGIHVVCEWSVATIYFWSVPPLKHAQIKKVCGREVD